MKKIKTALALCAGAILLSATSNCAQESSYETEKIERIEEYFKKYPKKFHTATMNCGLHDVRLNYDLGHKGILVYIFKKGLLPEFILFDDKNNGYGDVDEVYKEFTPVELTKKEKEEINDVYFKIINKFYYSKIDKRNSAEDWIKVLERTLKEYYREKEAMKKLEAILEKK